MPAFTKMLTCQFNVPLSYALQIWRIPCVHLSQLDVESDINLAYYKGSMTVLEFKYGHPCCELEKNKHTSKEVLLCPLNEVCNLILQEDQLHCHISQNAHIGFK